MNTGISAEMCEYALPQRQCPDVIYIPSLFFASEVSKAFVIMIITQSRNILTIKFLDEA